MDSGRRALIRTMSSIDKGLETLLASKKGPGVKPACKVFYTRFEVVESGREMLSSTTKCVYSIQAAKDLLKLLKFGSPARGINLVN